jgi:hypothetical protein
MPRKPPEGYEFHPTVPGLIRKLPPRTAARDFYPYLRSDEERRQQEQEAERKAKEARK